MAQAGSAREHGIRIGRLQPGPANSITDVAGVGVGHVTVVRDEPNPPAGPLNGRSPADPYYDPFWAPPWRRSRRSGSSMS